MTNEARAHVAMLIAAVLIATSFPVVGEIADAMNSLVLTWIRFAAASLLFVPWMAWRHGIGTWPGWKSIGRYALLSAPLCGFFWGMFEALRTTTPMNTGALFTLGPLWAALIGRVVVGERLDRRRWGALLLGTMGAAWVVFEGDPLFLIQWELRVGDGIFVAATAAFGLYVALVKRLHRGEPRDLMTFWTLATGTVWLSLASGPLLPAVAWSAIDPTVYGLIGYLALFTTLITFFLTQYAATVIGPARTVAYTYLNPAFVAMWAWVAGHGAPAPIVGVGIAVTAVAMALLVGGQRVQG